MAKKKKQSWYLLGALGAVGMFVYSRKKKEDQKAKATAVVKGAIAAGKVEYQKSQGDYIAIG